MHRACPCLSCLSFLLRSSLCLNPTACPCTCICMCLYIDVVLTILSSTHIALGIFLFTFSSLCLSYSLRSCTHVPACVNVSVQCHVIRDVMFARDLGPPNYLNVTAHNHDRFTKTSCNCSTVRVCYRQVVTKAKHKKKST